MSLTVSQSLALNALIAWQKKPAKPAILQGAAGFGKSFLIDTFLSSLSGKITPLLLAETNEAVSVLKAATQSKYDTITVCKALGLRLGFKNHKQILIRDNLPDLTSYNLIVVDEASQVDILKLEYLIAFNIPLLFVGHKSQLPPVDTELLVNDECISPVFQQDYPTYSLVDPVRNTGEIFEFCREVEKIIYQRGLVGTKFKVNSNFVTSYLKENTESLSNNQTVLLAYSNKRVAELNQIARIHIFGKEALESLFIAKDKVIFRSPTACFSHAVNENGRNIKAVLKNKHYVIPTNARGEVLRVNYRTILGVLSYELYVRSDDFQGYVYVAIEEADFLALRKKYYTSALYEHHIDLVNKKWKDYHDLTLLLSNTKHSYSMTIHCTQGRTINNVFVDDNDIDKCSNNYLKKKLRYVAYSRAKDNLYRM